MTPITGIITYFLVWWLVLFTVLPMGVERDDNPQTGTMTGAPKEHKMKKKVIATSIISAFVWIIIFVLMHFNVIDFYDLARQMSEQDDSF